MAEGFGLALIVAITTSYYAYDYDLLLLIVPLLAMRARPADAHPADRLTRYLEAAGLLALLLTPVYWFARVRLQAECLMTLPLLALGIALARRLSQAAAGVEIGKRRRRASQDDHLPSFTSAAVAFLAVRTALDLCAVGCGLTSVAC